METFDIYDINRNKTGEIGERGDTVTSKQCYRLAVHIVIFNDEGKMLIQQRSEKKTVLPNMWDISVGGGAISGEDSGEAASRELFEELGIVYDFTNILPNFTFNFDRGFDDFYVVNKNIDLKDLVLQEDEVQNVKWATHNEVLQMIDDGKFVNYRKELIELLFSIKDKPYGTWAKDD